MSKKEKLEKLHTKTKGLMKVLMAMTYKSYPIYIRMMGRDVFIWDVIFNNQLYSSYIVIRPEKGKVKLNQEEISEITKMCYAGAAATVDNLLGIKLSDDEEEIIKRFESARAQVEGLNNAEKSN
jgi:hypothetical protein